MYRVHYLSKGLRAIAIVFTESVKISCSKSVLLQLRSCSSFLIQISKQAVGIRLINLASVVESVTSD